MDSNTLSFFAGLAQVTGELLLVVGGVWGATMLIEKCAYTIVEYSRKRRLNRVGPRCPGCQNERGVA